MEVCLGASWPSRAPPLIRLELLLKRLEVLITFFLEFLLVLLEARITERCVLLVLLDRCVLLVLFDLLDIKGDLD